MAVADLVKSENLDVRLLAAKLQFEMAPSDQGASILMELVALKAEEVIGYGRPAGSCLLLMVDARP